MRKRLSEIDDKILEVLKRDGKCSTMKILDGINYRKSTVRYHINELLESGVIEPAPVDNCDVRTKCYRIRDNT